MRKRIAEVLAAFGPALVLAGSWSVPALAVECVSPDLAMSCYRTIQEALVAAAPGEVVAVYPGVYVGNISVDTAGVQLVGKGTSQADVVLSSGDGPVVSLNAPHLTLENVTVRGGTEGIVVTGVEATISRVIVGNSITGISVIADGARVIDSSVRKTEGAGIVATGAGFVLKSSIIQQAGGICVAVDGDGALVNKSRIIDCGEEGVKISGSAASILESDFLVAGKGMVNVAGPGARIRGNRFQGGRENSIYALSDNPIIDDNSASDCESAILVTCDSCAAGRLEGNFASGTYDCPGFDVSARSAGFLVRNNTSQNNSGDGFSLTGLGMKVKDNRAADNGLNGFAVRNPGTDIELLGNEAKSNARYGIMIESGVTGTIVKKNRASANGIVDYFDAGGGTILGTGGNRNHFGTVGGP